MTSRPPLILASTSRYRRELMQRLGLAFSVERPEVEEQQHAGESPRANCRRLALEKARDVAHRHQGAIVIGSDQVLDLDGVALSKPGDFATALDQLQRCQGRTLHCHTALAVLAAGEPERVDVVDTEIVYRDLSVAELTAYLEREQPFDAAGAVKVETAGITLLHAVRSDDPTAIIGLPLIRLTDFLRELGLFHAA
ncbi:MAG: Maf family nucleotide pyrophosphatase [Burkholderiales bacterium]|nr:Maf family nucleotide pyrophosphatase [Burkholderiales bacterium]